MKGFIRRSPAQYSLNYGTGVSAVGLKKRSLFASSPWSKGALQHSLAVRRMVGGEPGQWPSRRAGIRV